MHGSPRGISTAFNSLCTSDVASHLNPTSQTLKKFQSKVFLASGAGTLGRYLGR